MSKMPAAVAAYMQHNVKEQMSPLCLTFNANMQLARFSGELAAYNFPQLKLGMEAAKIAPMVEGLDYKDLPLSFPVVEVFDGAIAHVHLIAKKTGGIYVLLLDAKKEHKSRQIFQQKANEVQLLNEQLTKVLKQLNKTQLELKQKKHEAEQASALKSQFIANMSHEFRTPLTSIIGYTEMWQKRLLKPDQVQQAVDSVASGARFLLSLIENVLDQARFEAGEIDIETSPVNIAALLAEMAAMFAPIAKQKGLEFELETEFAADTWFELDEMRIKQLIINLCNNAIKYTDEGKVSLYAASSDLSLTIRVSDTGIGIEKSRQETIFSPFQRIDVNRNIEGAGLGLAISKQILDLMGGGLTLTSKPNQGSVFEVCLPVESITEQQVDNKIQQATGETVLVAEDNPDVIEMIELFLINAGFSVILATSGEEAVQMVLKYRPQLVLMDINMPILGGLAATVRLREQGYDKPILALSAASSAHDKQRAREAGCDSFLLKPIAMSELVRAVNYHLSL